MKKVLFTACVLGLLMPAARALDNAPNAEQAAFFEKRIRPVLAGKCYKCHSEESGKSKGGLLLDTREAILQGGDSGAAVVPGDLKKSLLITAVRYQDKDLAMPPEKAGGKLPDSVIADLETWVKLGAPDPRTGPATKVVRKADPTQAAKWWAFQPLQATPSDKSDKSDVASTASTASTAAWARTAIDGLVFSALNAKGLTPVADADKATLLRRVYFDLSGLPPSTAELDAFFKDKSPGALAAVVDRLLASPRFGERWGRHWLDVARFAESSGRDFNIAFPNAWRYRDYVIAAFNADKPFDRFVHEQLAGDLLPAADDKQRSEQLIATGFLAIGPKALNEQNPRQFALDLADEQLDTVSQAFLGLTVSCARCHDHKFDPIPQRDYYAMAGIFLSTDTRYGTARSVQNRHGSELVALPRGAGAPVLAAPITVEERQRKEQQLAELTKEQNELLAERFGARREMAAKAEPKAAAPPQNQLRNLRLLSDLGQLELELKNYDEKGQPLPMAMGVCDRPQAEPRRDFGFGNGMRERLRGRLTGRAPEFDSIADSALYARGDADKPGEKVPRGFVSFLTTASTPQIRPASSGRLELAEWITSPENPLTARVMANRVWQWLLGQGIVESTDNFGTTGKKPANGPLLDYLARRLTDNGWSVKTLVREIVLSRAYGLSSEFEAKNFALDPEAALGWRVNKRRLEAESIRDGMLAISGQIDLSAPTGSLIASAGDGPLNRQGRRQEGLSEEAIIGAAGNRRSVYLPVPRDILPDALAVFDFAEPTLVTGTRETTNVPAQALYMLNSTFVSAQARALAERIMAAYPGGTNGAVTANLDQRLVYAYWLVFSRAPLASERQAAATFFSRFPANWSKGDTTVRMRDAADNKAAWTSFCRALFASAEFRYLN